MPRKKFSSILFGAALLAFSLAIFFIYSQAEKQRARFEEKKARWLALEQAIRKEARNFRGKSGIVIKDLETNWQIAFNKEKLFPSASLVKIPIMAAVFQAGQNGKIGLQKKIKLKTSDKISGSGQLKNMPVGSEYSVEELVKLMITSSDNTATNMLIELLGFPYLNSSFKEFGLRHTNLSREMMDFDERKNGVENYTTAADISYILEKIYRNKLCNSFVSQKCMGLLLKQKAHDRIPAKLPRGTVVAHKTGLEAMVCHDAGIVFAPKGNVLICVLTKGAANSRVSKKYISNIALEVYNSYN